MEGIVQVGEDTCVCCRVDVATGPGDAVAILWRKVFPGDVRDMVLSASRDGGRAFAAPALVHDDGWKITACPHRGGALGIDRRGRIYASWYTEGKQARPDLYFATSGRRPPIRAPRRLHTSATSIPDHARIAVDREGLRRRRLGGTRPRARRRTCSATRRTGDARGPDRPAVDQPSRRGSRTSSAARWELHGRVARGAVPFVKTVVQPVRPHPRGREVSAARATS